jgi:hypothetical protein
MQFTLAVAGASVQATADAAGISVSATPYTVGTLAALACAGGLVIGVILGLNGFAQPATPGPLGQSPRIKNLLWLFSGLFPVFVADFTKLGLDPKFPWAWPFAGYGFGALVGAVGAIIYMVCSIKHSVRTFADMHPGASIDAGHFLREYLTYGKARYDERWKEAKDNIEAKEDREREKAAAKQQRIELMTEGDKVVARCVYGVLGHMAKSPQAQKESQASLIETIIDAIVSLVRAQAGPQLTLRDSYMAYVPANGASKETLDDLRSRAKFTDGMPDKYVGFLDLRHGGGSQIRDIVLPVSSEHDAVLPGAPEAVNVVGIAIMNIRKIEARSKVKPVLGQIRDYFHQAYFSPIASITSLVINDGKAIHGVVNIESSEIDLLGQGQESVQAIVARLQTLTALLSVFH